MPKLTKKDLQKLIDERNQKLNEATNNVMNNLDKHSKDNVNSMPYLALNNPELFQTFCSYTDENGNVINEDPETVKTLLLQANELVKIMDKEVTKIENIWNAADTTIGHTIREIAVDEHLKDHPEFSSVKNQIILENALGNPDLHGLYNQKFINNYTLNIPEKNMKLIKEIFKKFDDFDMYSGREIKEEGTKTYAFSKYSKAIYNLSHAKDLKSLKEGIKEVNNRVNQLNEIMDICDNFKDYVVEPGNVVVTRNSHINFKLSSRYKASSWLNNLFTLYSYIKANNLNEDEFMKNPIIHFQKDSAKFIKEHSIIYKLNGKSRAEAFHALISTKVDPNDTSYLGNYGKFRAFEGIAYLAPNQIAQTIFAQAFQYENENKCANFFSDPYSDAKNDYNRLASIAVVDDKDLNYLALRDGQYDPETGKKIKFDLNDYIKTHNLDPNTIQKNIEDIISKVTEKFHSDPQTYSEYFDRTIDAFSKLSKTLINEKQYFQTDYFIKLSQIKPQELNANENSKNGSNQNANKSNSKASKWTSSKFNRVMDQLTFYNNYMVGANKISDLFNKKVDSITQALDKNAFSEPINVSNLMNFISCISEFTSDKLIESGREIDKLKQQFINADPDIDPLLAEAKAINVATSNSNSVYIMNNVLSGFIKNPIFMNAENHPQYNILFKALGISEEMDPSDHLLKIMQTFQEKSIASSTTNAKKSYDIGKFVLPGNIEENKDLKKYSKNLVFSKKDFDIIEKYKLEQNNLISKGTKLLNLARTLKNTNGLHVNSDKFNNLMKSLDVLYNDSAIPEKSLNEKFIQISNCAEEYLKNKYSERSTKNGTIRFQTALKILHEINPEKEISIIETLNDQRLEYGLHPSKESLILNAEELVKVTEGRPAVSVIDDLQKTMEKNKKKGIFGKKSNSKAYQDVIDKIYSINDTIRKSGIASSYYKDLSNVCQHYLDTRNPSSQEGQERFMLVAQIKVLADSEKDRLCLKEAANAGFNSQQKKLEKEAADKILREQKNKLKELEKADNVIKEKTNFNELSQKAISEINNNQDISHNKAQSKQNDQEDSKMQEKQEIQKKQETQETQKTQKKQGKTESLGK